MAGGHVTPELRVVALVVGAEFKLLRQGSRCLLGGPQAAAAGPVVGWGVRWGRRRCRLAGIRSGCGSRQASGQGRQPDASGAEQGCQPAHLLGAEPHPRASGRPAMGHHSQPQGGRKGVILPWARPTKGGGSVCRAGSRSSRRVAVPVVSDVPAMSKVSARFPPTMTPQPSGVRRIGGWNLPERSRFRRPGPWIQSSRSFRLGVRLGSLARKPNTKIPMKKKTTE